MENNLDVHIVKLEPMRVASTLGFGPEPEMLAWKKMRDWADKHQEAGTRPAPRWFGFNNPDPSPGSPNYGYEVWMTVGPEIASDDTVTIKDIPACTYAVTRSVGVDNIYATWMKLVAWVETSQYGSTYPQFQCLEEHINIAPDLPPEAFTLDLYLPIKA